MNYLGHYVGNVISDFNEFPGLMRTDRSDSDRSARVKRAAVRIYIGGGKAHCDFIADLVRSEPAKAIGERGIGVLVVDKTSVRQLGSIKIQGQPLAERLQEIGVELVTIEELLAFYQRKNKPVAEFKHFYAAINKINFLSPAHSQPGDVTPEKIKEVAGVARKTLMSESYKYFIPWYLFEKHNIDVVAVMDLDTKAPLVPQNLSPGWLKNRYSLMVTSIYIRSSYSENIDSVDTTTHVIDSEAFPLLMASNPEFKGEYSFVEMDQQRAEAYANALFQNFYRQQFEKIKWEYAPLSEGNSGAKKKTMTLKDFSRDKWTNLNNVTVVDFFKSVSEMGDEKLIELHNLVDDQASLYLLLLSMHNFCVREEQISEIVRQVQLSGYENKITVCSDMYASVRKVYPMDHCLKLEKQAGKTKCRFDSYEMVIVGAKSDLVTVLPEMMGSPCSLWDVEYTISQEKWKIQEGKGGKIIIPCLRAGNITVTRSEPEPYISINHRSIPLTEEQPVNRSLLCSPAAGANCPTEANPDYLLNFADGSVCGVVSYVMDEMAERMLLCQHPAVRPVYRFGRNVLFGGLAFGSLQTAFSHFSDRWFSREPGQCPEAGWQRSAIRFCMNNALLLVPVAQGNVIPALCSMVGSMTGFMSARAVVQTIQRRGITSGMCLFRI
ncbi:hypothetical protein [Endozoicomonas sp.]|uniref:hypothetical protein n=1 Tax=Endozoicomonas sp. TaxID=1892382 RepID=UPI0028876122|nr:hypothetical protein [Endozoicomonas sp.]